MIVRDLNEQEIHDALYMFKEGSVIYLVHEALYEKFEKAEGLARRVLADIIIQLGSDRLETDLAEARVVKSRHF